MQFAAFRGGPMTHEMNLTFLRNIGKKFHLQILTLSPGQLNASRIDFGLRDYLSLEDRYEQLFRDRMLSAQPNTIYRLQDEFLCNYIYLLLPEDPRHTVLIAGPYITFEILHDDFIKEAGRLGVPPWLHRQVEDYYINLPVIQDASLLLRLFTAFGETIWGGPEKFQIVDTGQHTEPLPLPSFPLPESAAPHQLLMEMQIMETRYNSENELMQIISCGQLHRARQFFAAFVPTVLESRAADPVRNMKNYCIIGNTLMRKAAQQGGVHPVYLDRTSSDFAQRIESIPTLAAGQKVFSDMVFSYCRLVRKHTAQHYSPQIEKAVLCIEADLSQDLSLHALAGLLNLSPGYLSTLFHQETGQTITDFVNTKRMENAARLLRSSTLQVQIVAQYCGISDVNYFSKLFKRYYGMTPREYKKQHQIKKITSV